MSQEGNWLYRLHLAMIVVVNLNKNADSQACFPPAAFVCSIGLVRFWLRGFRRLGFQGWRGVSS